MIPWDVRQWSLLIDDDGIDLVYWVPEYGLDSTIRLGRRMGVTIEGGLTQSLCSLYGLWSFQ